MAVCMRRLTISGFQGRERPCGHILYAFLILNKVKFPLWAQQSSTVNKQPGRMTPGETALHHSSLSEET